MISLGWQKKYLIRRVGTAVLAGILLIGCADLSDDTQLAEERVRDSLPTQEFTNVEMIHTNEGVKQFLLRAPHLDQYGNQKRAELYGGITIDFFKEGRVTSHLTSDSGVVLRNGDELKGIGNVVVTTDTGTTILTPRMTWTRKDHLITSDTIVTIITEYDTLHGTGLVATDDLKKRRILQPTGVTTRTVSRTDSTAENTSVASPMGRAVAIDTSDGISNDTLSVELDSTTTVEAESLLETTPPDSGSGDMQ